MMPTKLDKPKWPDGFSITPIPKEERQCAILEAIFAVLAAMLEELKRLNAERGIDPGAGGRGEK